MKPSTIVNEMIQVLSLDPSMQVKLVDPSGSVLKNYLTGISCTIRNQSWFLPVGSKILFNDTTAYIFSEQGWIKV